jgi:hypothetical protein
MTARRVGGKNAPLLKLLAAAQYSSNAVRMTSGKQMENTGIQPGGMAPPVIDLHASRFWIERTVLSERLRREGAFLCLAAGVIALSFGMPSLESKGLWPPIPCLFNKLTHLPCLTCGLTRSFVQTAHGNIEAALEYHLLGPALFILLTGLCLYLLTSLWTGRRVRFRLNPRTRRIAFWATLAVFICAWVVKVSFMKVTW